MLSYLETVGRLTDLRDSVRMVLENEVADRQAHMERVEQTLTGLLGDLVTPDETPANTITVDLIVTTAHGDTRCRDCRADLWLDPIRDKYVALFDAACPVTRTGVHIPRR